MTIQRHSIASISAVVVLLFALIQAAFAFGTTAPAFRRHSTTHSSSNGLSSAKSNEDIDIHDFVDVASASTLQSCQLLGSKSIGVDYGLVRTGIAVSIGYEPQPICILREENATQVAQQVVNYCKTERAQQVVVGLPLHKNGTEAVQSNLTRQFAAKLACLTLRQLGPSIKIFLWDERYTSKEAAARILNKNPHEFLPKTLDADAACIILENYYLENGKGKEQVLIPDDMYGTCLAAWQVQEAQETRRKQEELDQRAVSRDEKRQEAMERARKMEEAMARDGTLAQRKKKKKRKKRK